MDQKTLGKRLKYRRENVLHLGQDYLAAKLNITQPAVSAIERGKRKFTDDLMQKIKAIDGFETFDQETTEEPAGTAEHRTIVEQWPWRKPLLYILITGVALSIANRAVIAVDEVYLGAIPSTGPNEIVHAAMLISTITLVALFMYWVFWKYKL